MIFEQVELYGSSCPMIISLVQITPWCLPRVLIRTYEQTYLIMITSEVPYQERTDLPAHEFIEFTEKILLWSALHWQIIYKQNLEAPRE